MSYKKNPGDLIITYELSSELTSELCEMIAQDIRQDLENSLKYEAIVFDLKGFEIDYRAFKILSPLGLELRKDKKRMYALSQNPSVHSTIKQEGMEKIICPIAKSSEISIASSPKKIPPRLDVEFVNPFIDGTIHVLNVQCKTQANPQKPLLKIAGNFQCQTDIAGIIGITSSSFKGSIAICFPKKVFLGLMSQMLGEELTEISDDVKDGAAELTNMIFGYAKTILNEKGHTIDKALPSVARGSDIKIDHDSSQDSIILPFKIGDEMFYMEIGTEKI